MSTREGDAVTVVNVYEVTRHYGGPEEGGWWYNWRVCVASVPLARCDTVDSVARWLRVRFPHQGNIYSVRGGVEYDILGEASPAESASTERPRYE